jgi:ornithine decarboxylase
VDPYYAVKCNPLPSILQHLAGQPGIGFDCASRDELEKVRVCAAAQASNPHRRSHGGARPDALFANPCKSRTDIRFAVESGVDYMTFDSLVELKKMKEEGVKKPVLRIHVDDKGGSRIPLNKKYGYSLKEVGPLIQALQDYNMRLYGLAFHVGSDCRSATSYESALDTAGAFTRALESRGVLEKELLDIGGGFSGLSCDDGLLRNTIAPVVLSAPLLRVYDRCIAEPGRFFAAETCDIRVTVLGRRTLPCGRESIIINESAYGAFSGVPFDGFKPVFVSRSKGAMSSFVVFGQTCDSGDIIGHDILLPSDVAEGDELDVYDMGAYSIASASRFNGFPTPDIRIIARSDQAEAFG